MCLGVSLFVWQWTVLLQFLRQVQPLESESEEEVTVISYEGVLISP